MSGSGGRGWTNGNPRQASLAVIGFADARAVFVSCHPPGLCCAAAPATLVRCSGGGALGLNFIRSLTSTLQGAKQFYHLRDKQPQRAGSVADLMFDTRRQFAERTVVFADKK